FNDRCRELRRTCLVVLFPTASSYKLLVTTRTLVTRPIGQAIERRGMRVLDLTPPLVRALDGASLCSIMTMPSSCRGHFSAAGNRLIAEVVNEYLGREGLRPRVGAGIRSLPPSRHLGDERSASHFLEDSD